MALGVVLVKDLRVERNRGDPILLIPDHLLRDFFFLGRVANSSSVSTDAALGAWWASGGFIPVVEEEGRGMTRPLGTSLDCTLLLAMLNLSSLSVLLESHSTCPESIPERDLLSGILCPRLPDSIMPLEWGSDNV